MGPAITLIESVTILLLAIAKLLGALTAVLAAIVGVSKGLRALLFSETKEWHTRSKRKALPTKIR